jgi:hypothetical protein
MDEQQAEKILRDTLDYLDECRGREASGYSPAAASELAIDDADWPWMPLSQLAFEGLAASRQHLNAVLDHYLHASPYPLADHTLLRSALLGAAQAVWMLAPDDRDTRTARARTVTAEMYHRHLQYLDDLSDLTGATDSNTETARAHVRRRKTELEQERTRAGQTAKLVATTVIQQAVGESLGVAMTKEVSAVWREGSGSAHGLIWHVFGRPGTEQVGSADASGMATLTVAASWQAIANPYMAAYHLLHKGWGLLDARGGTSVSTRTSE